MFCRVRLESTIESDIFGQWKGIYLDNDTIVYSQGSDNQMIKCELRKGDTVVLDLRPVDNLTIISSFECICIPSIYALNPNHGIVLTVMKIINNEKNIRSR